MASEFFLEVRKATKEFPGVKALDDVSLSVRRGEVHAIVGENGAGKSTLIRIIGGAHPMDSGEIWFDGRRVEIQTPAEALRMGISVIYQELNLVPSLTVPENIFLGHMPVRGVTGLVDFKAMEEASRQLLQRLATPLPINIPVRRLSASQQQIVEIATALNWKAKLIIMDEPTAPLSHRETERLFDIIHRLKEESVTVLYISHRLEEIRRVADRVTVLRDGKCVGTAAVHEVSTDDIVRMMVGREIREQYPRTRVTPGEELLRVEGLSRRPHFSDVSFRIRTGEVVSVFGLVGSGRTEMVRALVGADPRDAGRVFIAGEEAVVASPKDAVARGVGLLPEERKSQGLVLGMNVRENVSLTVLERLTRYGFVRPAEEHSLVSALCARLRVQTPSLRQKVKNLSGGNQQKVVVAKWFARDCRVFIFDEPTRGIDVGAKLEIYRIMNEMVRQGAGILVISSDLLEVIGISDRILVMREGRIVAESTHTEAKQEQILSAAIGEADRA